MKSLSLAAVVIATSAGTVFAQARITPSHPQQQPTTKQSPLVKKMTTPAAHKLSNGNHPMAGPNDSCSSPAIAVDGPNAWDNTGATLDGPQPCGLIGSDVWYSYTASGTGNTTATFCGGTTADTVMAVYNTPGTCPLSTDLIVCDDDSGCGLQSTVQWATTAGTTYMIQAGGFNGAQGTGTLTITPPGPPITNDDCSSPTVLVGGGPFPVDNDGATTGAEGQANANCLFYSTTNITNDVWYTWNATVTGPVSIDLCAATGTLTDSKMAVYSGAGCPSGSALACNDDSCNFLSKVVVTVTAGQDYTFQIGNFPGASEGTGTLTITPQVVYPGCRYDDGVSENSIGINAGGFGILWMHRFGNLGDSTVVSSISAAYGTAAFPGNAPPNGTAVVAGIWNDPTNDGDPTDAVLVATTNTTVQNVDTDILNTINFSPPVVTTGVYFVGVGLTLAAPGFPATLDTSTASSGRAWIVGNSTGACNYAALATNSIPPLDEDGVLPGVWLLRADCAAKGAMDPFCFGDGSGNPCPCGNTGATGNGCGNSAHPGGANMAASGSASLVLDTATLTVTDHRPSTLAVLFQGNPNNPVLMYGDGLRCIGGSLKRPFKMTPANAATLTIPSASSNPPSPATLSSQSAAKGDPLTIGAVRGYQLVYRDNGGPCGTGFNATNGIRIVWAP
jgi:hypothetical protein